MSERICSLEECGRPCYCKGYCTRHYRRWRRYGDPNGAAYVPKQGRTCRIAGCNGAIESKDLCNSHYLRLLRHGDALAGGPYDYKGLCTAPGCDRTAHARRMCSGHWNQWRKGQELRPLRHQHRIKDGAKVCPGCALTLPITSFALKGKYRQHLCRDCTALYHRTRAYGLTMAEVRDLLKRPCEGCGKKVTGKEQHIDHCHETGIVRGVLCSTCNTALGAVKDDPSVLRRLADYLERGRQLSLVI